MNTKEKASALREQAYIIQALYRSGMSESSIARRLSISKQMVVDIMLSDLKDTDFETQVESAKLLSETNSGRVAPRTDLGSSR